MQTREWWHTIDKSKWGDGPWQNEPDKVQWQDNETGYPCLIVRGTVGALCGYVGVGENHPAYGKDYNDVDVAVHGGLTYAARCQEQGEQDTNICHIPEIDEPDNIWWLGFDCAHSGDYCPAYHAYFDDDIDRIGAPTGWGTVVEYRDTIYVASICHSLAVQLKVMEG